MAMATPFHDIGSMAKSLSGEDNVGKGPRVNERVAWVKDVRKSSYITLLRLIKEY